MGAYRVRYGAKSEFAWGDHVFPTEKFRLLASDLERAPPSPMELLPPDPLPRGVVEAVHTAEYMERIRGYFDNPEAGVVEFEAPCSEDVYLGVEQSVAGTLSACRDALAGTGGFHVGGGFHHAHPSHGEGFCILNDIACSLAWLLGEGAIGRAAVVDLDVHQGNGTAVCLAGEPRLLTLSIHHEFNYPAVKPPSDLDVGLEDGCGDEEYLAALDGALRWLARRPLPDLVLFVAGADPYEEDQLGGLSMTRPGLRARDRRVVSWCAERRVPLAVTLAGGYARRTEDVVAIHRQTLEEVLA